MAKSDDNPCIAYFSAEFGLTECLSIFAGGLGILAGDHLKSASDLGVPLVGVGLLYQQGYFRQYLSQSGWQQESYDGQRFPQSAGQHGSSPERQARHGRSGARRAARARAGMESAGWTGVLYSCWTPTYRPTRAPKIAILPNQLYGGDREMRIRQEILLGIGGYRALQAIGLEPTVYHMNEGHSAFLALEHILHLMKSSQPQPGGSA